MAILANNAVRTGLQIALALVIVVLGYILFKTIREPALEHQRLLAEQEEVRGRMNRIRQALVAFERREDRFPASLDSLVLVIKTDSFFAARRDSIFGGALDLDPDSLPFSPRTGRRFEYAAVDTGAVNIYYLKDPDSGDAIGTTDPAEATRRLNVATWE